MSALVFICCDSKRKGKKPLLGLRFISWEFQLHGLGQLSQRPGTAGLAPLQGGWEAGRKQALTPGHFQRHVSGSRSVLFTLPGCLSGAGWGRTALSITLRFFPGEPEGRFRSLSFVLSARRLLCPELALGTRGAWGQTGRGGRGWTAAFLRRGSAATGPLFRKLLDWWSWKGAWSSSHLLPVSSQAESLLQLCSQHLTGSYMFPVTGSSLSLEDSLSPWKV